MYIFHRWHGILQHVDDEGTHAMEKLIRFAPDVAEEVLARCVKHKNDIKVKTIK